MIAETTNYTLRLPEKLKSRLERSARYRGLSMNQLVLEMIEHYYKAGRFTDGRDIYLKKNGRKLEIRVKPVDLHAPGAPSCWFYLDDPIRNMEVAAYEIGISPNLARQFSVDVEERYDVVTNLGMSLIHHHNQNEQDITRLTWKQLPSRSDFRQIDWNDLKRIDDLYIITEDDFHRALAQPHCWVDRHFEFPIKPILPASMAMTFQNSAEMFFDETINSVIGGDQEAVAELIKEKESVVRVIGQLIRSDQKALAEAATEPSRLFSGFIRK